jgi:hypothetical protein
LGTEAARQEQASVNKRHFDPANVQISPMKEEAVDAIAVIDGTCFTAPRPEFYRAKLDSAAKGVGITSFLVPQEQTGKSQVDCKGYTR